MTTATSSTNGTSKNGASPTRAGASSDGLSAQLAT
jgi:hypothetical protein